jgi:hypothetical protein
MTGVVVVSSAGCKGGGGGKRAAGGRGGGEEDAAVALEEMEIGWPTDVRHVAHVTFDRFHGFLGLPVEFEDEMPCRVPSAR